MYMYLFLPGGIFFFGVGMGREFLAKGGLSEEKDTCFLLENFHHWLMTSCHC